MASKKFLSLVNGKKELLSGVASSSGVAQAGEIVALGSDGKLDVTLLPTGVGPDVKSLPAFEDISAGSYVNIFKDGATDKVRLADNTNGRDAHGFCKTACLTGETAVIYFEGPNDAAPVGSANSRAYLGTAGGVITTALDIYAPANEGKLHQFLGIYVGDNEINTDIDDQVVI